MRRFAIGMVVTLTVALMAYLLSTSPVPTALAQQAPLNCTIAFTGNSMAFLETCG